MVTLVSTADQPRTVGACRTEVSNRLGKAASRRDMGGARDGKHGGTNHGLVSNRLGKAAARPRAPT